MSYIHANWLYRYEYNASGTQQIEAGVAAKARSISLGNHWYRIWGTFTTKAETTKSRFYFYTYSGKNITYYFCCPQVELGTAMTSWSDGDVFTTIPDSSGYGRNGTIVNTPILAIDTPRYSSAITFNENTDSIKIKPVFSNGQTVSELSVACWFKTNTLNSTAPNIFSLGANSFCRARIASATSIWWYTRVASTSAGVTKSCKTLTDNIWHHIVYTFKNGIETMYVDGVSVGTNDKTGTGTTLTCSTVEETYWTLAGYSTNSENFIGSESDFRIYCTALSAADAK